MQICNVITATLDDGKAEDVVTVDLKGKTSIADYMIIASGRSQRHALSLADDVAKSLKDIGLEGISIEGQEQGDWLLIDAGDVIIHIFRPEIRKIYNLERLWSVSAAVNPAEAEIV